MSAADPLSARSAAIGPVKVSVVIPCFNSARYVAAAVDSVLAQTARDYEIVLVDDGSEDDTVELLERILATNRRTPMRVVEQPNAGTAAARNLGIAAARGRYILPLDADDEIAPTMLEACSALLDADPRIDIVYTDREDFGDACGIAAAGTFALERLKYFNQIGYCSLFRRTLWETVGGYRVNVSGFDDWDFWLAAALRGSHARHLAQPLFRHRRRPDSLLWRLLPRFERLHAQIILNNRDAFSPSEVDVATCCLETGAAAPMLASARFVFLGHYYATYPATAPEHPCG